MFTRWVGLHPVVEHVNRERNTWADELSKMNYKGFDPNKRLKPLEQSCWEALKIFTEFPRQKNDAQRDGPEGTHTKIKTTLDRQCAVDEVEGRCSEAGHPLPAPSSTSDAVHKDPLDPGRYVEMAVDGTQPGPTHQSWERTHRPPTLVVKYTLDDTLRWQLPMDARTASGGPTWCGTTGTRRDC